MKNKKPIPATGVGAKVLFNSYQDPKKLKFYDSTGVIVGMGLDDRVSIKHRLRCGNYKGMKVITRGKGEWKYKVEPTSPPNITVTYYTAGDAFIWRVNQNGTCSLATKRFASGWVIHPDVKEETLKLSSIHFTITEAEAMENFPEAFRI